MLTDGKLLRIYIAESARIGEKPAYKYLLDYFREKGFSGCTVFRGMAGFGHENKIRTVDVLQLSLDLPIVIDVIDTSEKILSVLPEIESMVEHGQVMIQDVKTGRKTNR
nr:DUF190 domain-containing protein [uncultured Methanoregula sp.]